MHTSSQLGWVQLPALPPPVTAKQRVVKLLDMSLTKGQLSMQAKTLSVVEEYKRHVVGKRP